ncbi:MAG: molybdopterin-dependent oxidoreductase [Paracoccaceae bacterium]
MFENLGRAVMAIALSINVPAFADGPVLTISGVVAQSSSGDEWTFDMVALMELPSERIQTTTIWTKGEQSFEGVSLATLLEHVGATGSTIRAVALNDYAISIPVTDAIQGGPIVAYSNNGEEMSTRDRGPLWMIYPFDDNEEYKSEEYYSRSIWQLERLVVTAEK